MIHISTALDELLDELHKNAPDAGQGVEGEDQNSKQRNQS